MTVRALLLGLLLGGFIAGFTYFNDHVIRQTYLINNHLPASVFGVGIVLVLLNPLLARMHRRAAFAPAEVAVVLVMGLAVCGWPGTSFFRSFTHVLALPAYLVQQQPAWRDSGVLSYVPGGPATLADGQLIEPAALVAKLRTPDANDPAIRRIASLLAPELRDIGPVNGARLTPPQRRTLLNGLNRLIHGPELTDAEALRDAATHAAVPPDADPRHRNRALLAAALPDHVLPAPAGSGVLVGGGQFDPDAMAPLLAGSDASLLDASIPWGRWWPTIRLWGGVALLMAMAVLCLTLVVHPQWSQRELLPYPTARFVQELTRGSDERGGSLLSDRLFLIGLLGTMTLHGLNSLHAWFPLLPSIPLRFDFGPLADLFPVARRVPGFWELVRPVLFPAVIGFGFFVSVRTAASLGVALFLWVVLGVAMLGSGLSIGNGRYHLNSEGPALRFGAYAALAVVIVYVGRRYYKSLALRAVGLGRGDEAPRYAAFALWGLVACSALSIALLRWHGALNVPASILLVSMVLVASLVLMRLNAETGLFYAQPDWHVAMVAAGFLGIGVVGPSTLIVLLIGSALLMPEPREGLSPFLLNALRIGDGVGDIAPPRTAGLLAPMLLLGFVLALVATLTLQHRFGLDKADGWAPTVPRDLVSQTHLSIARLEARGELAASNTLEGLDRLALLNPSPRILWCIAGGAALVLACSVGRFVWAWWPLHPIAFAVWGTYASNIFAASFLMAALVKWAVVSIGGERLHRTLKPLAVGLIAGDLLSIMLWAIVGTIYFAWTGQQPRVWYIFPP